MQSLNPSDIRRRLLNAFRRYGFYMFTKEEYAEVSRIIRATELRHLLKLRALNSRRTFFVLELDSRVFIAKCRDSCEGNAVLDNSCYVRCKEANEGRLMSTIIEKLASGS
ncbi:MAG: hypothetical protein B6U73_03470 [Desulfurococcales archaeon ex4484_204]|nr:MAG: hypothetical protein B6U73_03470 [Desulfurococcales archaeon ex4484_204]